MPLKPPLKDVLYDWNPWWTNKDKIKNLTGKKREDYINMLTSLIKRKEILCLTGVRRCGKTTVMYQLIEHLLNTYEQTDIVYINFDDERLVPLLKDGTILEDMYKTYLEATGKTKPLFVFFDEIQNIKGWEKWMKRYYDTKNIKFIVTGSSSTLSQPELSALLTGRNISIKISPLSFKEFLEFRNIKTPNLSKMDFEQAYYSLKDKEGVYIHHFEDYLEIGGFPEAVLEKDEQRRKILLQQYFKDILFRDIIARYPVKNEELLEKMVTYLMENISNLLSHRRISNATGTTVDTVKRYLNYVEKSLLISKITVFTYSTTEQLIGVKPIKIYAADTGMRNQVSMRFSKDTGRLAENAALIHLLSHYDRIHYWRNKGEVDFVVDNKICMQVCYGEKPDREIKNLREFNNRFSKIILTRDEFKEGKIPMIPLWLFCLRS